VKEGLRSQRVRDYKKKDLGCKDPPRAEGGRKRTHEGYLLAT
jgi:hypothetical protein